MTAIDLVASDLDGTFLNSGSQVSPLNAYAVRRAEALGVRVVFATGRPYRWLQPLTALTGAHPLVIASNGAIIYDVWAHQPVEMFPLPQAQTVQVAADLEAEFGPLSFAIEYATGGWGSTPGYPPRGDLVPPEVTAATVAALSGDQVPLKLLVYSPTRPTEVFAQAAAPVVGDRLCLSFSIVQPCGILELCAPGVDKASTLVRLLRRFGVPTERVAAFGDMPNDLPLLRLARYPYVMANAHPSLFGHGFAVADDHDRDGFATALLDLLGEPMPDAATVE